MEIQLIGEGNTAEVYTWGEADILKLFRKEFPLEGVEKEFRVSKEIEKLGLPTPKVGELIEYDGRNGIIYEKIKGASLLTQITKRPWVAGKYAKQLAKMHYEMHQCKAEGLASYKESLEWNILHTKALSEDKKQAILQLLNKLPEGEALCHGDFHPGNVIESEKQFVILDWMTATCGNPSADVARTILLMRDAALPGNMPGAVKKLINLMRNRMTNSYLKNYIKLSNMSLQEIEQWRLPIIAARLTEWIPESEKNSLLIEIGETLSYGNY